MRFMARVEERQPGAIGIFCLETYTIDADSLEEARDKIFDLVHSEGKETRGIVVFLMSKGV